MVLLQVWHRRPGGNQPTGMVLLSDKVNESSFKYTPSLLGEVMCCTSFFSSKEEEESIDGRPLYVPEILFLEIKESWNPWKDVYSYFLHSLI